VAQENRWSKCPNCDAFVYHKRLERNLKVCPECNYHFRLPIRERLHQLLDADSFTDMSSDLEPIDALGFTDSKPYPQRIAEAQSKTGNREGGVYGSGTIDGRPIVVAAQGGLWTFPDVCSGVGRPIPGASPGAVPGYPG